MALDLLVAAADALPPAAPAAAAAAAAAAAPARPLHGRLTEKQRWAIVVLKDMESRSNIDISEKAGVSTKAVRRVLKRYRETGTVHSGSRSGRPRCTTEEQDTEIAVHALVLKFTSPKQVRRKLSFDNPPSEDTIDRRMQEAGLFGRVARHKRDYSDAELRKRLSFAQGYKDWTAEQWEKVLFSDEKCFYADGFCGRTWVRRPKGEALNPEYCVQKLAHPAKVNVWACFCAAGTGYAYIFNKILDATLMAKILRENLVQSAQLFFSDPPVQWYFLHDNDKKFKFIELAICRRVAWG